MYDRSARLYDATYSFDLGWRFDAVTCLFSAIGHVLTVERLRAAVAAMARHLEPGGVLLVEPWISPERWCRCWRCTTSWARLTGSSTSSNGRS